MASVKIKFNEIASINLEHIEEGITASNIKAWHNPDVFINLALYDMTTKENIVKLIDDNIESGYLFADKGIGITTDNKPIWCSLAEAKTKPEIVDYVSGAPVLVVNSKINIDWGNKVSTQIQGKHIRSAIGISDNELVLYVSDTPMTLEVLASTMISLGCKYAINCDGGGSSHLYADGKTYKASTRANPTWLLVYKKKEENKVPKKYKICLDAGHGGNDPGATSGKFYEKDINLKVVKAMQEYLEPYVDVVLTRDSDKTVSLEERVDIANNANVDLYFSVHCNASDNTAAKGWEIYIVGKGGNAEKLAKRVEANVFEDTSILGLKNRGIKVANFYVLKETNAPAVLVENAFISNTDDRTNILKSDFTLNCLAYNYSKAILERLGISTAPSEPKESNDFDWALTVLSANGIVSSEDYWKNNKNKVQYLEQLIINMAKYVEDNK